MPMHLGLQISIMESGVRPVCGWEEREVTVWTRNSVLHGVNRGVVPIQVFTRHRRSHKNGLPMS